MPLGPAPRQIKVRSRASFIGMGCARLFILPHTLVGIGMILLVISKLLMGLAGTTTDGRILEKTSHRGSKGSTTYKVKYSFNADHTIYEGSSQIDREIYNQLPEQGRVPVVYLSLAPQYLSDYQDPNRRFPSNTWFFLFMAIFWNAIVSVFVYLIYIGPWRRKRLIINGAEADGKILAKRTSRGSKGGTRYHVDYTYDVLGEGFTNSESTSKDLYDQHNEGDPVSVAYNERNPKRSVAVDLSEWEIV